MAMGTEGTRLSGGRKPPSLPTGLRARTRATSRVVADDTYDEAACTPPLRPAVTVPFLWEEAPGRPKMRRDTAAGAAPAAVAAGGGPTAAATTDGGDDDDDADGRPVRPLKLPPRLQVTSKAEYSRSRPKTVILQGPYGCTGGKWPPRAALRRSASGATFRRASGAGGGLFSWRKATAEALGSKKKYGHDNDSAAPDASCCSPASSSSSSSSSSLYCLIGDHGHGAHVRQPADGREDSEGPVAADGGVTAAATDAGDHDERGAEARPVPEDGGVTAAAIDGGAHDEGSAGARTVPEDGGVTAVAIDGGDHDGGSVGARPVAEDGGVTATAAAFATEGGGHDGGSAGARPVPLKLPPRLHRSTTEHSVSPKTVLQGPYGCTGGKKPPRTLRRSWSVATFRRTPSAGEGIFARGKAPAAPSTNKKGGHDHDSPCCSPSASSSSSSSLSCIGDDQGHGAHRRPTNGRGDSEEDDGAKWPVRITRFRRNRSLTSMTTSHLWASIRKSVKQITPWS